MKNSILKFGLYGVLLLIGANILFWFIFGTPDPEHFRRGEIFGYTTIILSLVFIFFGIKNYRDEINEGKLNFWKGILIGLAIAAIPALAFGIYNYIYMEYMDPEFVEKYMSYSMQKAEASMSSSEFEQYAKTMDANKGMYINSFFQSIVMFFTVFLIGFVVSFLSALILKK